MFENLDPLRCNNNEIIMIMSKCAPTSTSRMTLCRCPPTPGVSVLALDEWLQSVLPYPPPEPETQVRAAEFESRRGCGLCIVSHLL